MQKLNEKTREEIKRKVNKNTKIYKFINNMTILQIEKDKIYNTRLKAKN